MDAPRSETSSENLTRSGRRMMPLRSQVGFSNAQQNHRTILPHEVDHNYGEPRRPPVPVLSRHQRSVDELENQDESESLSSRLRHRTLVNNSLRTSTRTTRHSQTTNTDQNSDSDDDNTPLNRLQTELNGTPPSSSSRPQRSTRRNRVHDSEDDHHDVSFTFIYRHFLSHFHFSYPTKTGTRSILRSQHAQTKATPLQ